MNEQEFKERTKAAALRVIKLTETLPSRRAADVLARQLLQCSTSIVAMTVASIKTLRRRSIQNPKSKIQNA
jgi:hypothetical protein